MDGVVQVKSAGFAIRETNSYIDLAERSQPQLERPQFDSCFKADRSAIQCLYKDGRIYTIGQEVVNPSLATFRSWLW